MPKPEKLVVAITTKFSTAEAEALKARAELSGVPVRTFIRRCVRDLVQRPELSPETALVLTQLGRVRGLITRLALASVSEAPLGPHQVMEIADQVDAIDPRVLVGQMEGK